MLLSWLSAALRTVAVTCFFTTSFFLLFTAYHVQRVITNIVWHPVRASKQICFESITFHFCFPSRVQKQEDSANHRYNFFRVPHSFHFVKFHGFFSSVLPYPVLMLPSHHMNNDFAFLTTKQAATLSCVPCTVGILLFSRLLFAQFLSQCFAPLAFFLGVYSLC